MKQKFSIRLVSFLLVIMMMLSMAPVSVLSVVAWSPSSYKTITAGSSANVSITNAGSSVYFRYVPVKSGTLTFYSTGSYDTYGYLLDANGTQLTNNDDGGNSYNFSIDYEVIAGQTYYLQAKMYNSSKTGSFTVCLKQADPVYNTADPIQTESGTQTYTLFSSGRTGTTPSSNNNASGYQSLSNDGYDIYARANDSSLKTVFLGLPFTVTQDVTEQATLSIYAYDIDESQGERDLIYLCDQTAGTSVQLSGYLHGMDSQWNTSTFQIDASQFITGHTYCIKLTESVAGWVAYVRNVSLELVCGSGSGSQPSDVQITAYDFTASINNNGQVTTNLSLTSSENVSYTLEYSATINSTQYGSATSSIDVTPSGASKTVSFYLQSAPTGTYTIDVTVKKTSGAVKTTYSTQAGYKCYSVNYNSNGGSKNLPHDTTSYTSGDTATVLFNNIPVLSGYVFTGWALTPEAKTAQYTADGAKTFTVTDNVTLYAVWELEHTVHEEGEFIVDTPAGCTTSGTGRTVCAVCGETMKTSYIPATGHSYEVTASKEASCTENGYITYTCSKCQDSYTVTLYSDHNYELTKTVPATCTEAGYKLFTCSACQGEYREEIPAGHHEYVSEIIRPSTTEQTGLLRYTCSLCQDSYDIDIPMLKEGVQVLLVQDRNSWETITNLTLLNNLVDNDYIAGWEVVKSSELASMNLAPYDIILIADDQYASTYASLKAVNTKLTDFATAGGVLVYGACDNGWTTGNIDYALPGGAVKGNYYSSRNYIVDATHPVVTAALTDGNGLTNEILYHNYCSHAYFSSLPENARIILQDNQGKPTLAEYTLGDGLVIVNGLTWEHAYHYLTYFGSYSYATRCYDDLLIYAATCATPHTHHYDDGTVVEPTCTERGYTLHTCADCGLTYRDNFVDAKGHTPGAWVEVTSATCTENGTKTQTCTECEEIIATQLIPALGHNYVYTETIPATCTEAGCIRYTCSRQGCSDVKEDAISALGHDFGDDDICDVCGYKLPYVHTHNYTSSTVAPTCMQMGYTLYSCACGASYRENYVEPSGHKWNDGVVTVAKTCTTDGLMTYTCTVCEVTDTEVIPASHNWVETITLHATCTTDGTKTLYCADCGETEEETIPGGHTWDEGIITSNPDCVTPGTKTCTCTVCSTVSELEVPALGHNFVNGVCTRCQIKFIDIVNDDLSHLEYGMYFEIDDIISNYGPDAINEYGVLLDYNQDATLEKVAVYLTQNGTMWRRCIACTGEGITYATYVPYLAYDTDIKYTGLNSQWINTFSLKQNADGIWNYNNYATIGVNLQDRYGNLLLSLYNIGKAGTETRLFDNLDDMIAWLSPETAHEHSYGDWTAVVNKDGYTDMLKRTCSCGQSEFMSIETTFYTTYASGVTGDTIDMEIYVKAGSYLSDLQLNFNYDSANFTINSVTFDSALSGISTYDIQQGSSRFQLIYSQASQMTEDIHLATVSFTITGNAVYQTRKAFTLATEGVYNVCHTLIGGQTYTVEPHFAEGFGAVALLGPDPNGDGKLDIFDLMVMLKALSAPGYSPTDPTLLETMDASKDGRFDVGDITYLQAIIAQMN